LNSPGRKYLNIRSGSCLMIIVIGMLLFSSCSPLSRLKKNEYLLTRNIVKIDNKKVDEDELKSYIKQKPNRKVLGIRFHLSVYNLANHGKERRIKRWMKNTIGEAPVILDTMLTNNSVKQITLYLRDKGYFKATVSKRILYRKKTADVTYIINTGIPYITRNITYLINDPNRLQFDILSDTSSSLLKKGKNYDVDDIQNERDRITKSLKNNGYFGFVKQYINFKIDTNIITNNAYNKQFDITIEIKNPTEIKKDTVLSSYHSRYLINNIFILTDYNTLKTDTIRYDTIEYSINRQNIKYGQFTYFFLYKKKMKTNPKTFTQAIFIKPNNPYKINDVDLTYKRLLDLQLFKFVNINFSPTLTDSIRKDGNKLLDCIIQVTNTPLNSYTYETEGTNSGGDLGIAGNIIFQNKNTFRNAEIFLVKLKTAMEFQRLVEEPKKEGLDKIPFFNTIEAGAETSIKFPKFLLPVKQEKFAKSANPKTYITLSFNFQQRKEYTRYISNIVYGYEWRESRFKKHIINPFDISSINNKNVDSAFKSKLNFYLISATTYSYIFSNQEINKLKNFTYFRGNLEFAGNFLQLKNNLLHSEKNIYDYYTLFGIEYAQFFRADADVRKYLVINAKNRVVFRAAAGVGIPYGNSQYLPYDKSFYAGGANGLRAWKIRSIGPGGYDDTLDINFNKSGDLYLETNLEYRFAIVGQFGGAIFSDAGNVWLQKENIKYPNGEFQLNRFYKEIAVDFGIGFRYDFSFFVIRLDVATAIRNPALPEKSRWKISRNPNFSIGIGYPF
jgi:outer membrane protein assembly factor BamA